jgi:hypothetical protein
MTPCMPCSFALFRRRRSADLALAQRPDRLTGRRGMELDLVDHDDDFQLLPDAT